MPVTAGAPVDAHHRERRFAVGDQLGSASSTPQSSIMFASLSLPCNAITGRSILVCPGGMAMTQLVLMPPRAADTNEPVSLVGRVLPAVGGSNGAGAAGAATVLAGSARAPSAHAPAAPRLAPAPMRSTVRRVRSATIVNDAGTTGV